MEPPGFHWSGPVTDAELGAHSGRVIGDLSPTIVLDTGDGPSEPARLYRDPRLRRLWSDAEIATLHTRYPTAEPVRSIAADVGRTPGSIYGKARRLGLKRLRRRGRAVRDTPVPVGLPGTPETSPIATPSSSAPKPPISEIQARVVSEILARIPGSPAPAESRRPDARPFRLTPLGGREGVWGDQALVDGLALLWSENFRNETIAQALGLPLRAARAKASRLGLPYRGPHLGKLSASRDVTKARALLASGSAVPWRITGWDGRDYFRKTCNDSGIIFYGRPGQHTSPQAKENRRRVRSRSDNSGTASGVLAAPRKASRPSIRQIDG